MNYFDREFFTSPDSKGHRRNYPPEAGYYPVVAAEFVALGFEGKEILEIGAGLGQFVAAMRQRGLDARGIDVSEWAVENSFVPGYVTLGDIRNGPLPQADVVFIWNVLAYLTEKEIVRHALPNLYRMTREALIVRPESEELLAYHQSSLVGRQTFRPYAWWDRLFESAGWVKNVELSTRLSLRLPEQQAPSLPTMTYWEKADE